MKTMFHHPADSHPGFKFSVKGWLTHQEKVMVNPRGKPSGPNRNLDKGNSDDGKSELKHASEALDEALMESFPASDPVAVSVTCIVTVAAAPRLRTF